MISHLALLSQTPNLAADELSQVAAAVQKQVLRDFAPVWGATATVDMFERLDQVPVGYWPVIVRDDIGTEDVGVHRRDDTGQPFALVRYTPNWSLVVSHECLEMIADPEGNRLVTGNSLKSNQGRVQYVVEVCDPCESATFGYSVNSVLVSDFCTPHYYDPVANVAVRYSFTGAITAPREVLDGGYLTWIDPATQRVWQLRVSDGKRRIRDLGVMPPALACLRRFSDRENATQREAALARRPRRGLLLQDLSPRRGESSGISPAKAIEYQSAALLQFQIDAMCRLRKPAPNKSPIRNASSPARNSAARAKSPRRSRR